MSECTSLKINVIGTKRHGSAPEIVKDAIKGAIRIYQAVTDFTAELSTKGHNFVCTLPVIKGGERYNVFSENCILQGTIRSFEKGLAGSIIDRINQVKH